jgi:hypothetical protein
MPHLHASMASKKHAKSDQEANSVRVADEQAEPLFAQLASDPKPKTP